MSSSAINGISNRSAERVNISGLLGEELQHLRGSGMDAARGLCGYSAGSYSGPGSGICDPLYGEGGIAQLGIVDGGGYIHKGSCVVCFVMEKSDLINYCQSEYTEVI